MVSGAVKVAGEVATVSRETLDSAVSGLFANAKIPSLSFGAAGLGGISFDLYKDVPDAELIYEGDNVLTWDQINFERLSRGLPALDSIGYPRPPEEESARPVTPPVRRVQPNGTLVNFNIDRKKPNRLVTVNGQTVRVYGEQALLDKYFPKQPTTGVWT